MHLSRPAFNGAGLQAQRFLFLKENPSLAQNHNFAAETPRTTHSVSPQVSQCTRIPRATRALNLLGLNYSVADE